jgi:hypothetical protein
MDLQPNIGIVGRRVRYRLGMLLLLVAAIGAVAFLFRAWTPWRLVVFFPLAAAAATLFEARRRTCVVRAIAGTVEDDAGGTTSAPACDLPSSRRAARQIVRDAVVVGVAGAALLAAL